MLDPGYARLHADARRLLTTWTPPDAEQGEVRDGFLTHLDAHPGALSKQGPPAHLTASALVLDEALDHVLLTLHRKAGIWLQFGGHFEPEDGTVLVAATREAREESGIADLQLHPQLVHLDRHALVAAGFGRCDEHLDLRFVGTAPAFAEPVVSEESEDVRWWPVAALPPESAHEILPLALAARRTLG